MISFTVITSTPAVFRNALVNRGFVTLQTVDGVANVPVPTKPGLEWVEVPNPIMASGTGTELDPYIPDTRRCFLVKMAHEMHDDQIDGLVQDDDVVDAEGRTIKVRKALLQRTKWGQWILANSTADTITSADGRSWPARKVGTATWLVASDDFGIWQ